MTLFKVHPLYKRKTAKPKDRKPQRSAQLGFSTVMSVLAWLTFMVLAGVYFFELLNRQHNPNSSPDSFVDAEGIREVVLKRNRFGHYVTDGKINGNGVTFMLDTGATGVAIPDKLARQLGVSRGQAIATQTANGISTSYATTLDSVSVGHIELREVRAVISPGLATTEVLLGMSFLRHIEFTQRGDTLVLRQY